MTTGTTSRSRVELLRGPTVVGAAGLSGAMLLHVRDPHDEGTYGLCPFLALTGHPCPGCGGLRAVNDLTHGDVLSALSSNLLAIALVATLAVVWVSWTVRRGRGVDTPMMVFNERFLWPTLVVALVFGVVRNTTWGAWLAP